MRTTNTPILIDVATAPLPAVAAFLDTPKPPSNWKDPAKIDAYIAEKRAERLSEAALDVDLARLSGAVWQQGTAPDAAVELRLCQTAESELALITELSTVLSDWTRPIVTYNGLSFDLPMLMRRARYLGVKFPIINLDRYRTPHRDLCLELSDRDPGRRRSLAFYIRRHGWADLVKPLSGEAESQVFDSGDWAGLEASLRHDVEALRRLAAWWGVA